MSNPFTENEISAVARLGVCISELESMAKENGRQDDHEWIFLIECAKDDHACFTQKINGVFLPDPDAQRQKAEQV